MINKIIKLIKANYKISIALIIILVIAIVGIKILPNSHAESPYASVEAESGTLSGSASTNFDVNASGGSFVQFNQSETGFITRQGSTLYLNGQPYYFTGINAYDLVPYDPANNCGGYYPDINEVFAQLRPNSLVRVFVNQGLATNQLTQTRDWTWIDQVVQAAANNNQRLIMVIGNQWGECDNNEKTVAWYAGGYMQPEPDQIESYWDYMQEIVNRYKDSPAVGMWELMNEPYVGCGNTPVLRSFFDTVGGELKSIDPNHLLEMGGTGGDPCGITADDYSELLASPAIDVGAYHDYEQEATAMPEELQLRINDSLALNKPIIVGESGIDANDNVSGCDSTQLRANEFQAKMDAAFAAGVSGYLPWGLSPNPTVCNTDIGPGDPTLTLIHDYALP